MPKTILFCLGRYGDIINALPIAWREHKRGNRTSICVANEFASIMDGVGYADRITYPVKYNEPERALGWLKANYPAAKIINAQAYRHPTDKQRLTPSYQAEAWRLAGRLEEFGMWPTVFDRRSASREQGLIDGVADGTNRPMILVGLQSVSSPLKRADDIMRAIKEQFGQTHRIVNLAEIRAQRIYDLLGLFDKAACLVTADTAFLHLARASRVPVVALISEGNVGVPTNWFGSVPGPTCAYSCRYSEVREDWLLAQIAMVVDPIYWWRNSPIPVSGIKEEPPLVFHVVDMHGDTPRHQKAKESWAQGVVPIYLSGFTSWTELMRVALRSADNADIIIWSNSDTIFTAGAFEKIKQHTILWGACSIRRIETDGRKEPHIGRDVFAFRAWHLKTLMDGMPDFFLGACAFDLVLAALIRKTRGIPSCKENLHDDIFPCEMPAGLILHEPHESAWAGTNEHTLPANLHNKALAKEWCAKNCPTLQL